MRIRKRSIRAHVKRELLLAFSVERISAHGGLEVFGRFLLAIDLPGRLRRALRDLRCEGDYGARRFVLCLVGLLLIGGRRITHLRVMERDPVILRFAGVRRLPTDRTLVRWMKRLPFPALERLATVIRDLVYDTIAWARLTRLTIDADGTVLRTGLQVENAERGYNPHHPKDKSYYPLTAHLAQTGQILRVMRRWRSRAPGRSDRKPTADPTRVAALRLLGSAIGLVASVTTWLAFFPPAIYRRRFDAAAPWRSGSAPICERLLRALGGLVESPAPAASPVDIFRHLGGD